MTSLTGLLFFVFIPIAHSKPPNIIFILADDLGWNDVGFHGSNQIPTPNIDALAYTGIILNNYYVAPLCTPSRGALMTGKYPIRIGLQYNVIHGCDPYGLSLTEKLLPEYLKERGYVTRAVGKWHLGNFKKEYTPLYRGFDSHYGYWTGHQDYYDHTAQETKGYWGYDMRRGMNVSWIDYGKYTTDLLAQEAVSLIKSHNGSKPLFLYLAQLAVHSANPYRPLQAPSDRVARFKYIENENRRIFAAMLSKMDDSVGKVVRALKQRNMLEDSIIIFSTDNGGPAAGFNLNAASNWPLRGVKDTLWEGGVRGSSFIWSPLLEGGRISNQLMHITDWLPTLLEAANVKLTEGQPNDIDGVSHWKTLSGDLTSSRKEVLLNIDLDRSVVAYIKNGWKILKGNAYDGQWNDWYGPDGRNNSYSWDELFSSAVSDAVENITPLPNKDIIMKIREETALKCVPPSGKSELEDVYLFNLTTDPCETNNVASTRADILRDMEKSLLPYFDMVVPPRNKPTDPQSNPKYWNYAWINWKDYVHEDLPTTSVSFR